MGEWVEHRLALRLLERLFGELAAQEQRDAGGDGVGGAAHTRIVAMAATRQRTGGGFAAHPPCPARHPEVRAVGLLNLRQQLERPLRDALVRIVWLDAREQLEQEPVRVPEHALARRPAELDQPSILTHGARLGPAVGLGRRRRQQVAAPQPVGLLFPRDRRGGLVVQQSLTERRQPLRIPLPFGHYLGIGPVHERRARRLQQPGQRQPMGRGDFQALAPRCGGRKSKSGANLCRYVTIGQRQLVPPRLDSLCYYVITPSTYCNHLHSGPASLGPL